MKIPPATREKLLAKAAEGLSAPKLAQWLKAEHGLKVSAQAINGLLRKAKATKGAKPKAKDAAPKRPGRRTVLTPELRETFVDAIRKYGTIVTASQLAGITEVTVANWLARGREGESPFVEFLAAYARARGVFKQVSLDVIRSAVQTNGSDDWKARAWILERTLPDEFGPSQAVNVKLAKELEATLDGLKEKLPHDVYRQVLSAIAGESGEGEAGAGTGEGVDVKH